MLKNIYFFHSLPDSSLEKIVALGVESFFERGAVIFFEDLPGDCFFVILEGEVEILKRHGQPDEVLLGVSGAGQPVGEMALIDERPRSATVRARTDVRVFVISASDFKNLLHSENAICIALLRASTMMVRRSNESHLADLDRQNKELARANAELKAAQHELLNRERLSVVGKFSSLILHDIRNPLSALKSRVELLRLNYKEENYCEEAIKRINDDISRMEDLAAEFLDYARGEIRLQMSVCDLNALFDRFRDSFSVKFQQSSVVIHIENFVAKPVILDENRMLRVLINASENAYKAMPTGGTVSIVARQENGRLIIVISDTGVGMSQDVLSHMFEPFYSASSAGGTGLGMIIIKNIVDAHNGNVSIASKEGSGTTLTISLPSLI